MDGMVASRKRKLDEVQETTLEEVQCAPEGRRANQATTASNKAVPVEIEQELLRLRKQNDRLKKREGALVSEIDKFRRQARARDKIFKENESLHLAPVAKAENGKSREEENAKTLKQEVDQLRKQALVHQEERSTILKENGSQKLEIDWLKRQAGMARHEIESLEQLKLEAEELRWEARGTKLELDASQDEKNVILRENDALKLETEDLKKQALVQSIIHREEKNAILKENEALKRATESLKQEVITLIIREHARVGRENGNVEMLRLANTAAQGFYEERLAKEDQAMRELQEENTCLKQKICETKSLLEATGSRLEMRNKENRLLNLAIDKLKAEVEAEKQKRKSYFDLYQIEKNVSLQENQSLKLELDKLKDEMRAGKPSSNQPLKHEKQG